MSVLAAKRPLNLIAKSKNSVLRNATKPIEESVRQKNILVFVSGAERHSRQMIRIFCSVLMSAENREERFLCSGNHNQNMSKAEKIELINPRAGENTKMIRLVLTSADLPAIDISDPEQVKKRISQYFDFCCANNWFPSICGMANWLGIHRDTINSWKNGFSRKETHQKIIGNAYNVIESCLVDMLINDKISAPAGIFLLKSMFGYKDRFDIGLEAAAKQSRSPLDDLRLSDEEMESLRKKYLIDSIPEEEQEEGD